MKTRRSLLARPALPGPGRHVAQRHGPARRRLHRHSPPAAARARHRPSRWRSCATTSASRSTGQLATTTVDQEFYNPNASRLEGYYLFPLPAGAVIKDFSMWIDGRETRAELLDAAKARGIYEDIVRRLRDPALLEYDGRGVFKMRVFPIEPRSTKEDQDLLSRSPGKEQRRHRLPLPAGHGKILGQGHPRGQHRREHPFAGAAGRHPLPDPSGDDHAPRSPAGPR